MKPDDLEFVRQIRARINPAYVGVVGTESYERSRFLTLLYEAEGMANKLCHKIEELEGNAGDYHDERGYCEICLLWTDADWIAAVRKEIEG